MRQVYSSVQEDGCDLAVQSLDNPLPSYTEFEGLDCWQDEAQQHRLVSFLFLSHYKGNIRYAYLQSFDLFFSQAKILKLRPWRSKVATTPSWAAGPEPRGWEPLSNSWETASRSLTRPPAPVLSIISSSKALTPPSWKAFYQA